MITNNEQLEQTRSALNHLETAIASLKRDVLPLNPSRFAIMAEPAVDHIKELRAQIDEYIGVNAAVAEEVTVWMRLQGESIEYGDAPTSIVAAMLDIFRRGVQTVAEFLQKGMVSARPTAYLKKACDLRIVAWESGSVQVGLRLPEAVTEEFEEVSKEAKKALQLYLHAASWVGTENDEAELEVTIPDPEQRRLLLNQVSRLIPRQQGGLESVELFGRGLSGKAAKLRKESRERVRRAIQKTVVQEEAVLIDGFIREIDLDERAFIIRDPAKETETRCQLDPESPDLLEIAKEGLDKRVAVMGIRKTDPTRRKILPVQVYEIDILGKELKDVLSEISADREELEVI